MFRKILVTCILCVLGISANPIPNLVCETISCVRTAHTILQNMNTSVHPCENFYQFACGSFVTNTIIPDDKSSINTYSLQRDMVHEQLYSLLEKPVNKKELTNFQKTKNYYKFCKETCKYFKLCSNTRSPV